MRDFVLHGLAAMLWLLALYFAMAMGMFIESKDDRMVSAIGCGISLCLAIVAFTLQVIA